MCQWRYLQHYNIYFLFCSAGQEYFQSLTHSRANKMLLSMAYLRLGSGGLGNFHNVLGLVVLHGRLDGILGEHGAMQLDGRELKVGGDVGVLDGHALLDGLALEPLGRHGRRSCRPKMLSVRISSLFLSKDTYQWHCRIRKS